MYSLLGAHALMMNFVFGPRFGFNTPRAPTTTGPFTRAHSVSGSHSGQVSWLIQRLKNSSGFPVEVASALHILIRPTKIVYALTIVSEPLTDTGPLQQWSPLRGMPPVVRQPTGIPSGP